MRVDICSEYLLGDEAAARWRRHIHKLVKQHPGAFVVTGCAQPETGDGGKIEGVRRMGAEQRIPPTISTAEAFHQRWRPTQPMIYVRSSGLVCVATDASGGGRRRLFHCTIPVRGRSRNGSIALWWRRSGGR